MPSPMYAEIVAVKVDGNGNLRLYRRGRFFKRQDVFHPADEWLSYSFTRRGWVTVETKGAMRV